VTTFDPLERVRRARRRAASVSALVAVAALLLSLVVLRVWLGRSGGPTAAPPSPSVVADGGPDLRWEPFRPGHDLPESLSAGPSRHVQGRVGGFARSSLGVALAAIHIGNRIDPSVGSTTFEPTIKEQVIGPGAEDLLERTSNAYEATRRQEGKYPGEALEPRPAHLVAYQVESYTPGAATVAVISGYPDRPEMYRLRLDLQWVDGDWHLVAPPGGDLSTLVTPIQALPAGAVALSRSS
jgi:hypothetical protein